MKAYRWSRGYTLISAVDEHKWLTLQPGRFVGKRNTLPVNKELDGPQSQSGQFVKEKICVPIRIGTHWLVRRLVGRLVDGLMGG